MSLNHFKSNSIAPVPAGLYQAPTNFTILSTPNSYQYTIVADRINISLSYSIECASTSGFDFNIEIKLPDNIKRRTTNFADINSSSVIGRANGTPQFFATGTTGAADTDKMVLLFRSTAQATAPQQYDVFINCSCRISTSAAQIG